MKKLSFFAFLAIALMTLTSCTDDSKLIIGKWVNTANTYETIETSYNSSTINYEAGSRTWIFNEDGTMVEKVSDVSERTRQYTLEGDTLNIDGNKWTVLKLSKKALAVQRAYTSSGETVTMHSEFTK